jgi:hypothetical protein
MSIGWLYTQTLCARLVAPVARLRSNMVWSCGSSTLPIFMPYFLPYALAAVSPSSGNDRTSLVIGRVQLPGWGTANDRGPHCSGSRSSAPADGPGRGIGHSHVTNRFDPTKAHAASRSVAAFARRDEAFAPQGATGESIGVVRGPCLVC